jgi:hypothetical protein
MSRREWLECILLLTFGCFCGVFCASLAIFCLSHDSTKNYHESSCYVTNVSIYTNVYPCDKKIYCETNVIWWDIYVYNYSVKSDVVEFYEDASQALQRSRQNFTTCWYNAETHISLWKITDFSKIAGYITLVSGILSIVSLKAFFIVRPKVNKSSLL